MDLKDRIQRDIDEIAQFGYCNYSKTFRNTTRTRKLHGLRIVANKYG